MNLSRDGRRELYDKMDDLTLTVRGLSPQRKSKEIRGFYKGEL